MTDARLRAEWLGRMKFDALSDTAWRVFTGALMWSVENGTDGKIPSRYLRYLHPDGEQPAAYDEILEAGIWEESFDGYRLLEWDGELGQSTAAQMETYKENARIRQRRHREQERKRLSSKTTKAGTRSLTAGQETRDLTREQTHDVTSDVGEGKGEGKGNRDTDFGNERETERGISSLHDSSNGSRCIVCGGELMHPVSLATGVCARRDAKHARAREEGIA